MNPLPAAIPTCELQTSRQLADVPLLDPAALMHSTRRLVVVAPHPDDEILIGASLLPCFAGREQDLLIIAVTDGEASHPGSRVWTREALRRQRPQESREALTCLGLNGERLHWVRLCMPDSQVADDEDLLAVHLMHLLHAGDRVLTTWRGDGHCDHEAVGRACAVACRACDCLLMEAPVWAWNWAHPEDPRLPWKRACKLPLDRVGQVRKRQAINAHVSQVRADEKRPPVLSTCTLERLLQPFELVFM